MSKSQSRRPAPGRLAVPLAGILALGVLCPGFAQQPAGSPAGRRPADDAAISGLRDEIRALREEYETRLSSLEARLAALESGKVTASGPPEDELASLRAAAQAEALQAPAVAPPPPSPKSSTSQRRSLNALNPEISATGIVLASASDDDREEFAAQEFELDLQASLDPFSRTRVTIALGEGEVEVEEGYILYSSLPGGLSLTAGKFRQQFGALNRQHLHALPQTEYPLVLRTFFTDEGLGQTGLSLRWLLPQGGSTATELTFETTSGDSEAFGGELFEQLVTLAHVKSFWETGDASWVEWGLSGVAGETGDGGDHRVWGSDFTVHWQPPARAKYRELTWRTEVLLAQRDDPAGLRHDAWGGYSYVESLLARNLYLGMRYDHVEDPLDPAHRIRALVPYLTWWQSEFVRLRSEAQLADDNLQDDDSFRFLLQVTWAAGPHKHETY